MAKDTIVQSYENLLNFATAEHSQDHADGFTEDKKADCITCDWLADAEKNYDILQAGFVENK